MKNIKIVMLAISVVCIILIVLLIIINRKNDTKEDEFVNYVEQDNTLTVDESILILENEDIYFSLEQIAKYYINYNLDRNKQALYGILDKNYVKDNSVTENNILDKIELIPNNKDIIFNAEKIYNKEITTDIIVSFIYGTLQETSITENYNQKLESRDIFLTIITDYENSSYSVYPTECEYISNSEEKEIAEIQKYMSKYSVSQDPITKNNYNEFNIITIDEAQLANKYFLKTKNDLKNNIEKSYNSLDLEYRDMHFSTLNEYQEYINNRIDNILTAELSAYQKISNEDYNEYTCVDTNGNYYIFRETSVMNFTVMLDSYTIENKEFIELYKKATNGQKVATNINKFFEMINAKDYSSAYKVLDTEFKNNYFRTEKEFEDFIEQRLYKCNSIEFLKFDDSIASIFKYNIKFYRLFNIQG